MRMSDSQLLNTLSQQGSITQEEADIVRRTLGSYLLIASYNDSGSWLPTSPKTADAVVVMVFDKVTFFLGR